jgi:hypothetical protein
MDEGNCRRFLKFFVGELSTLRHFHGTKDEAVILTNVATCSCFC